MTGSKQLAVLVAWLMMPLTASAAEILVNSEADTPLPAGNTVCSLTPGASVAGVCTLRAALTLSRSGDTIRMANNVALIQLENGQLEIRDRDIDIYGSESTRTTIDAQGNSRGLLIDTFTGVTNAALELRDLVFTNGRTDGAGGAILVQNRYSGFGVSRVLLNRVTLTDNHASSGGGVFSPTAVDALDSSFMGNHASPTESGGGYGGAINAYTSDLRRTEFTKNTASQDGGAVVIYSGIVADSRLRDNTALQGIGGAITASQLQIERSDISSNAAGDGGGIALAGEGFLSLRDSSVDGNTASGSGGGLFTNNSSSVFIDRVSIDGNHAFISGAGWLANMTGAVVLHSSISGNVLDNNIRGTIGGIGLRAETGAWQQGYAMTFSNVTFASNRLAEAASNIRGGAVFISGSGKTLFNHVTIADNNLYKGVGSGVYVAISSQEYLPEVHFANSIVTRNTGTSNCDSNAAMIDAPVGPLFFSNDYNAMAEECPHDRASDFVTVDAGLDPAGFANNGGPTKTIALMTNSPAIDAANPSQRADGDSESTDLSERDDQRGVARPVFGGTAVRADIGAYEFEPTPDVPVNDQPEVPTDIPTDTPTDVVVPEVDTVVPQGDDSNDAAELPASNQVTAPIISNFAGSGLMGRGCAATGASLDAGLLAVALVLLAARRRRA